MLHHDRKPMWVVLALAVFAVATLPAAASWPDRPDEVGQRLGAGTSICGGVVEVRGKDIAMRALVPGWPVVWLRATHEGESVFRPGDGVVLMPRGEPGTYLLAGDDRPQSKTNCEPIQTASRSSVEGQVANNEFLVVSRTSAPSAAESTVGVEPATMVAAGPMEKPATPTVTSDAEQRNAPPPAALAGSPDASLPRTASNRPLLGLAGVLALALAAVITLGVRRLV